MFYELDRKINRTHKCRYIPRIIVINDYKKFQQASIKYEILSPKDGFIKDIDALNIAKACKILGAGRVKKTDTIDYSAGIYLNKKYKDAVSSGNVLATIYTKNIDSVKEAERLVLSAYEFVDKQFIDNTSMIYKIID